MEWTCYTLLAGKSCRGGRIAEALPAAAGTARPGASTTPSCAGILTCPTLSDTRFLERWLFSEKEGPMRKSRFIDEQMVAILREAERTSVAEAASLPTTSSGRIDTDRPLRQTSTGHSSAAKTMRSSTESPDPHEAATIAGP